MQHLHSCNIFKDAHRKCGQVLKADRSKCVMSGILKSISPVADPGFGQGGAQLVGGPNFETGRIYA